MPEDGRCRESSCSGCGDNSCSGSGESSTSEAGEVTTVGAIFMTGGANYSCAVTYFGSGFS
jgi:hypothetical protein